jgi:hypothetical protein
MQLTFLIAVLIVQILSRAQSAPAFNIIYLFETKSHKASFHRSAMKNKELFHTKKRERMFLIDFSMVVSL